MSSDGRNKKPPGWDALSLADSLRLASECWVFWLAWIWPQLPQLQNCRRGCSATAESNCYAGRWHSCRHWWCWHTGCGSTEQSQHCNHTFMATCINHDNVSLLEDSLWESSLCSNGSRVQAALTGPVCWGKGNKWGKVDEVLHHADKKWSMNFVVEKSYFNTTILILLYSATTRTYIIG